MLEILVKLWRNPHGTEALHFVFAALAGAAKEA
jgi:hypothetical protein